jgi:hypothetical protein
MDSHAWAGWSAELRRRNVMDEQAGITTDHPTHGCMERKAQRPYTVAHFANGNTGWRYTVCGKILRLLPGKYSESSRANARADGL